MVEIPLKHSPRGYIDAVLEKLEATPGNCKITEDLRRDAKNVRVLKENEDVRVRRLQKGNNTFIIKEQPVPDPFDLSESIILESQISRIVYEKGSKYSPCFTQFFASYLCARNYKGRDCKEEIRCLKNPATRRNCAVKCKFEEVSVQAFPGAGTEDFWDYVPRVPKAERLIVSLMVLLQIMPAIFVMSDIVKVNHMDLHGKNVVGVPQKTPQLMRYQFKLPGQPVFGLRFRVHWAAKIIDMGYAAMEVSNGKQLIARELTDKSHPYSSQGSVFVKHGAQAYLDMHRLVTSIMGVIPESQHELMYQMSEKKTAMGMFELLVKVCLKHHLAELVPGNAPTERGEKVYPPIPLPSTSVTFRTWQPQPGSREQLHSEDFYDRFQATGRAKTVLRFADGTPARTKTVGSSSASRKRSRLQSPLPSASKTRGSGSRSGSRSASFSVSTPTPQKRARFSSSSRTRAKTTTGSAASSARSRSRSSSASSRSRTRSKA